MYSKVTWCNDMERVIGAQLIQNDASNGDPKIPDDTLVWGCRVERFDDDDKTKGDVAQLVKVPSLKSTVQCNVPG